MSNADLFDLELNDPSNDSLQSEDKSDDDHIEVDEERVQVPMEQYILMFYPYYRPLFSSKRY